MLTYVLKTVSEILKVYANISFKFSLYLRKQKICIMYNGLSGLFYSFICFPGLHLFTQSKSLAFILYAGTRLSVLVTKGT